MAYRPDVPDDQHEHIDYRFSLANERTFLAWIRTALALIAGGLAIVQLLDEVEPAALRRTLGVPLVLLGGLLSALAFFRWQRNERAMRDDAPLPRSIVPVLLAVGATLGGLLALVMVLVSDVG